MTVDPTTPEVLVSVPTEVEAAAIVANLDAYGIRAFSAGGYTAGFKAEAPGMVNVLVRHDDLALARRVLAELQQRPTDIDWSQVDIGDPE